MEKFVGTGKECYEKYADNNRVGRINRVGRENELILIPTWLSQPCTYTPPEPQWIECSAGEGLDAVMQKGNVQLCMMGENIWVDVPEEWTGWTTKMRKYRKEA